MLSLEFSKLKKRLWLGTLVLDGILLLLFCLLDPQALRWLAVGIGLGLFYLWSLTWNAENPKKNIQFAFSTLRAALFAYAIVSMTHAKPVEMAIVFSGFLSYKVILTVEYVLQALPVFVKVKPANDK